MGETPQLANREEIMAVHERAEREARRWRHEIDLSSFSAKDARGHPLSKDNDPLLELLKEGKR